MVLRWKAGSVSGDITWINGGMDWPYVLNGDVDILSGATLHLPAGTVVKFRSSSNF